MFICLILHHISASKPYIGPAPENKVYPLLVSTLVCFKLPVVLQGFSLNRNTGPPHLVEICYQVLKRLGLIRGHFVPISCVLHYPPSMGTQHLLDDLQFQRKENVDYPGAGTSKATLHNQEDMTSFF